MFRRTLFNFSIRLYIGDEIESSWQLLVMLGSEKFNIEAWYNQDGFQVQVEDRQVNLKCDWKLGDPLMLAEINDEEVTLQLEGRVGDKLQMRHYGNQVSGWCWLPWNQSKTTTTHLPSVFRAGIGLNTGQVQRNCDPCS